MAIRTKHSAHLLNGTVQADGWGYANQTDGSPSDLATHVEYHLEYQSSWSDFVGPPAMERRFYVETIRYVGRVLDTYNRTVQVMSDDWALVAFATVLDDNGDFVEREAGVNVEVDASPELVARWEEWRTLRAEFKAVQDRVRAARKAAKDAATEAATPRKGKLVVVAKGRKVPIGTAGEVLWEGQGTYGPTSKIRTTDGTEVWIATSNLEVGNYDRCTLKHQDCLDHEAQGLGRECNASRGIVPPVKRGLVTVARELAAKYQTKATKEAAPG